VHCSIARTEIDSARESEAREGITTLLATFRLILGAESPAAMLPVAVGEYEEEALANEFECECAFELVGSADMDCE